MAQTETSVQIAAPPELVFAFFVPQRMPYWYGAEMKLCLEVQGGAADFAVAQKVRITVHVRDRELSHTAVVTEFQQARLLEWRFEDSYGVKGLERWELERAGPPSAPGTVVRMRSDYKLPALLGKVMDWFVTRHLVGLRNRDYLNRLKRFAERGGGPK
jgi:uncharacterized protein YndB with AHSA1/START domain